MCVLALNFVMDEYIAIYGKKKSIVMTYCYSLLLRSWSIASLIKSIASLIKSIVFIIIDHKKYTYTYMSKCPPPMLFQLEFISMHNLKTWQFIKKINKMTFHCFD